MKAVILVMLLPLLANAVLAEETNTPTRASGISSAAPNDVTSNAASNSITIGGTTYEGFHWGRLTSGSVTIYHKVGIARIPLAKLPPELQKQFGYDPQKAAAWEAAEQKADAAWRATEQEAAAQRAAAQKIADQKAAEQRLADQKVAEQKAAEQKAAQQKAAAQRAAAATARPAPGNVTVDDILKRIQQNYGQPGK